MKIAVIGCGNMAQSLVVPMKGKADFVTYTPTKIKANYLADEVDGNSVADLCDIDECDYYLIGCKPQQFDDLSKHLVNTLPHNAIIISMMAGVSTETIKNKLNIGSVVRIMPNTPVSIGTGVVLMFFTDNIEMKRQIEISNLFNSVGYIFTLKTETEMNIVTPFSGSGPAYFFEIARILETKLISFGIDKNIAHEIISFTMLGSAKMMIESDKSFEQMRDDVTSNKGVTYEALKYFNKHGLEDIFGEAIDAAYKRTLELSN